jgi:hypothetical protein
MLLNLDISESALDPARLMIHKTLELFIIARLYHKKARLMKRELEKRTTSQNLT